MIKMTTIIYNRTSTEQQNPENQLKDCLSINKYGDDYEILEEKESAYKDIKRPMFDGKVKPKIKQGGVRHFIAWDVDRIYRNRKKLIEFFKFCKMHNCQIHSYRQQFFEAIHKMPEPFNEAMFDFMLQMMGWLAEDDSKRKSDRVKAAVRKRKGRTISYKGNLWGRKSLSNKTKKEIVDAHKQGMSIREIADSVFYWDKNNNRKSVSKSAVHKCLREMT